MISNFMSEVQLYATHGATDIIFFKGEASAIKTGNSIDLNNGHIQIGILDTAKKYWAPNTKLITYIACNTGGTNGFADNNLITHYSVAIGGVDICVGFKKEIFYDSAEAWSRNYNMYLASGYGVLDAVDYANSISYNNNNVHSTYLVYNGDKTTPNMKIGKYANFNSMIERQSISADYLHRSLENRNIIEEKIKLNNTISNDYSDIYNVIKKKNKEFNIDEYNITREVTEIEDVATNKRQKIEYIDLQKKIGDYYTTSGYVAKIIDNEIVAIYENNLSNQKNFLNLEKDFKVNYTEVENIVNEKISKIKEKTSEDEKIDLDEECPYRLYYDIENNKKYIELNYKSEITINNKKVLANKSLYIEKE